MQAVNMSDQFSFRGPATEVEAQHLIRPLGRGSFDPQADQQARNKGRIHGCIGKKGATYAAFFRGVTNVWGVSRSWIAAGR